MRLLAAISLALFLASCSGKPCKSEAGADRVSLCMDGEWEQLSYDDIRRENLPEETLAILQTKEQRGGQRNNIVITKEQLPSPAAALTYALANINTMEAIEEYALLEKRDVEVSGAKTILHIFTAKPVTDLPARRFYQLSLTSGNNGYVITGTLPFTVDKKTESSLIEMIMSSKIK